MLCTTGIYLRAVFSITKDEVYFGLSNIIVQFHIVTGHVEGLRVFMKAENTSPDES